MNFLRLRPNPDPQLTVIHLGLLARPGLEAHGRQRRPFALLALRSQPALHLHDTARETQPLQLPVQYRAVKANLGRARLDK